MNRLGLCFALCALAIVHAAPMPAQQDSGDTPLSRAESLTIDVEATVSAIDRQTREIELTDAQGNVRRLTADERLERFDEIQVGDRVNAQIEIYALAEVRQPTQEELANLDAISRGVVRAPEGGPVAGSMAETTTSVVTVVALSLLNKTLSVLTADGHVVDILARSEDNLKQLRLGDTIVITYAASLVVSVSKP